MQGTLLVMVRTITMTSIPTIAIRRVIWEVVLEVSIQAIHHVIIDKRTLTEIERGIEHELKSSVRGIRVDNV